MKQINEKFSSSMPRWLQVALLFDADHVADHEKSRPDSQQQKIKQHRDKFLKPGEVVPISTPARRGQQVSLWNGLIYDHDVDLTAVEITEAPVPKSANSKYLKSPYIPILQLKDNSGNLVIYSPGVNDDVKFNGTSAAARNMQTLLDSAVNFCYIDTRNQSNFIQDKHAERAKNHVTNKDLFVSGNPFVDDQSITKLGMSQQEYDTWKDSQQRAEQGKYNSRNNTEKRWGAVGVVDKLKSRYIYNPERLQTKLVKLRAQNPIRYLDKLYAMIQEMKTDLVELVDTSKIRKSEWNIIVDITTKIQQVITEYNELYHDMMQLPQQNPIATPAEEAELSKRYRKLLTELEDIKKQYPALSHSYADWDTYDEEFDPYVESWMLKDYNKNKKYKYSPQDFLKESLSKMNKLDVD